MKAQVYLDERPKEYFDRFHERGRTREPDFVYEAVRSLTLAVLVVVLPRARDLDREGPADRPGHPRAEPLLVHGPLLRRRRDPAQGPVHGQVAALQAADAVHLHARRRLPGPPRAPRRGGDRSPRTRSSAAAAAWRCTARAAARATASSPTQAKPGIGRLALETGATVVPVAIHGSSKVRNWKRLRVPEGDDPVRRAVPLRAGRGADARAARRRRPTRSSTRSRCSTTGSRPTAAATSSQRVRDERRARGAPASAPRRVAASRASRAAWPPCAALAVLASSAASMSAPAAAAPPRCRSRRSASFAQPVYVTAPPGDTARVFVVQKERQDHDRQGRRRVDVPGPHRAGCARRATSRACCRWPSRPTTRPAGMFYVYYTARRRAAGASGSDLTISAFRRTDADHADPASARVAAAIPHREYDNHNGGQLQFGPDGLLWIGHRRRRRRQRHARQRPADQPVATTTRPPATTRAWASCCGSTRGPATAAAAAARSRPATPASRQREIWAYGLRNPWRFSFDRATGDLIIGDVGQDTWEEVDFAPAAPGGWPAPTTAGTPTRADHPRGSTASAGAPRRDHDAGAREGARRAGLVQLDRRRLRRPRPGAARPRSAATCTPTPTGATSARRRSGGLDRRRATGLHVSTLASFGEDACGRVYAARSTGRSTA